MTQPPTLLLGAGGLLGSAVARRLKDVLGGEVVGAPVPWADPVRSGEVLERAVDSLFERAGGGPWRVAWCAGAGVTASSVENLESELAGFRRFLEALAVRASDAGDGRVFYASSAGGVYAGSAHPPYDETSPTRPLAPYGHAKLRAEAMLREIAAPAGIGVAVGRIANLYGPGQNLTKAQGLISQLCRSHVLGRPLSVYVPLDTVRDYIYVDDCAAMVGDLLTLPDIVGQGEVVTKVLASRRPVTIAAVLGECRRVFQRRPAVILGMSPVARLQARDIRLWSVALPEIDVHARTTLAAGIHRTLMDVTGLLYAGPDRRNPPR